MSRENKKDCRTVFICFSEEVFTIRRTVWYNIANNLKNTTERKVNVMNRGTMKKMFALVLTGAMAVSLAACGLPGTGKSAGGDAAGRPGAAELPKDSTIDASVSFAEAHDAFRTTLVREENDDYPIPAPPEGVFDLVSFPSKVGELAAYVSSDPGDGEKHPMIIWIVGGWGNGIDDFPWVYPERDDDQTGSAFWQSGILTMYPSFRGGNGNPGCYEALFGEVDDIVSAYEYAASLPYVDTDRIYLGGHSTGGTRALLASEYTDKFRAVFCFGAVDEIKYHNNSQFTFDTDNVDEHVMRSPIYWLDNVKSPTFLVEGRDGNSENLERIQEVSENDNIHCYVIDGEDHFSVLAPATRLIAEKILEDTGDVPAITITQEELEAAMEQELPAPVPVMTGQYLDGIGVTFLSPYLWELTENEEGGLQMFSRYEEENAWDMSALYIDLYSVNEDYNLDDFAKDMADTGYRVEEISVDGHRAMDAVITFEDEELDYYRRYVSIETDFGTMDFNFVTFGEFMDEADVLFQNVIDSIRFDAQ